MNRRLLTLVFLSAAACSAGRPFERVPLVPPLAIEQPKVDLSRDTGSRAAADRSASEPIAEPVQRAGETASSGAVYRSVVHIVETPVYVEPQQQDPSRSAGYYVGDDWQAGYAPRYGGYYSGYYDDRYYHGDHGRSGYFPVNTLIGASIGAAIGNRHGHSGRGALIGGGIGSLLDLPRWWR